MKRLYPAGPIIGVGAVVVRDRRILLEKRKNDPGRNKWSIPGGVVELGESIEETIIREVKEETGLIVSEPELIDVINQVTLDDNGNVKYHFVIIDYFVKLRGGTANAASDAGELEWVPLDEVENKDLTKSFRLFFQKNRKKFERINASS